MNTLLNTKTKTDLNRKLFKGTNKKIKEQG